MSGKIKITNDQMHVMLVAVEHGYRQCEKGSNLQSALASIYDLYEVAPSYFDPRKRASVPAHDL